MERITPSVRSEHVQQIEDVQEEADGDISDAEAVRRIFDRAVKVKQLESEMEQLRTKHDEEMQELRSAHDEEVERLESELQHMEARHDDLQRQLAAANARQDDINELVEYVEQERSLRTRQAEREEQRYRAGIVTKAKWTLFGMPSDADD